MEVAGVHTARDESGQCRGHNEFVHDKLWSTRPT